MGLLGGLIGGGIGFLVGGPAGAAVGFGAGYALGEEVEFSGQITPTGDPYQAQAEEQERLRELNQAEMQKSLYVNLHIEAVKSANDQAREFFVGMVESISNERVNREAVELGLEPPNPSSDSDWDITSGNLYEDSKEDDKMTEDALDFL